MSNFPRDLLQRMKSVNPIPIKVVKEKEQEEEEEELELSLGLSMNGRFGVDPRAKKIKRTSSIPEVMNHQQEGQEQHPHPLPVIIEDGERMTMGGRRKMRGLGRTSSLPLETEEEWRKRKEMKSLRRVEARRKHPEKQRNRKVITEGSQGESEEMLVDGAVEDDTLQHDVVDLETDAELDALLNLNDFPPEFHPTSFNAGVSSGLACTGGNGGVGSSSGSTSALPPRPARPPPSLSNSKTVEKISESESLAGRGTKLANARSPVRANSAQDGEGKSPVTTGKSGKIAAVTMRTQANENRNPKDMRESVREDMPCVSTRVKGPNGKRIRGFLYRYGKGEEVRILCVCHGSFLTPAEFVKHAGGGDVVHPLKHIVICPSFF